MGKIIYSDLLNQTEFLRSLAKKGVSTLGVRVMPLFDLCHLAMLKLGLSIDGTYISDTEQSFIINSISKFPLFSDGVNMKNSINTFRETGNGNDVESLKKYLKPIYDVKLQAMSDVFAKYVQYKKDNHLYDAYDLLYLLDEKGSQTGMDVSYYSDLPYSPFIISLLKKLFVVKEERYASLFTYEGRKENVCKCLGTNNEISYVLETISKGDFPLDECLIVVPSSDISNQLINYLEYYDLPYETSIGQPYSHSNVGKFIKRLLAMEKGMYGVDAYRELFNDVFFKKDYYLAAFNNDAFLINDFIKSAGWLRLGFDHLPDIEPSLYYKETYEALVLLKDELSKGIVDFIKDNVIDDGYSFEATTMLERYVALCNEYHIDIKDVIDELYSSSLSSHISSPGKIYITTLNGGFSSIREHAFIMGLDASFPGSPKENYLIYDEEFIDMGMPSYTSEALVKEKEKMMNLFISSISDVYLSYSYFDNVDLKNNNPSSIISNKYDVSKIKQFNYEDDTLSNNHLLIGKYNKGYVSTVSDNHTPVAYDPDYLLSLVYSPSGFGTFFTEPLSFALNNIYGLSTYDPDDPYEVIAANDKGTLFHNLVRWFDKNKISKSDFLKKGDIAFNNFLKKRPPIVPSSAKKEYDLFMDVLGKFYDAEEGNKPVKCEEKIQSTKIDGVNFKGTFDRLEQNGHGDYILVDYKTGRTVKHVEEDVVSCIQGLLYAVMIEKEYKIKVSYCEFRYPFAGNTSVKITYDATNRKALKAKIDEFIAAVRSGVPFGEEGSFIDKYKHLISLYKEAKRQ